MPKRRWLFVGALIAAGCNALTGVGDFAVRDATDAGATVTTVDGSTPDVAASSADVQQPPADVDADDDGADADAAPSSDADADADEATEEDVATSVSEPTSCADVLARHVPPSLAGMYTIDPDGNGGAAAYDVFCDLTTAGGGWTEIFRWTTALDSSTVGYTNGSPALMSAASSVLITYRSTTGAVVGNTAVFPMPADWRPQPPFQASSTDVNVSVSVNGAAAVDTVLRYGTGDYATLCTDDWEPDTATYGRLCIESTTAPFFTGFDAADTDYCDTSDGTFDDTACTTAYAFSIAVR